MSQHSFYNRQPFRAYPRLVCTGNFQSLRLRKHLKVGLFTLLRRSPSSFRLSQPKSGQSGSFKPRPLGRGDWRLILFFLGFRSEARYTIPTRGSTSLINHLWIKIVYRSIFPSFPSGRVFASIQHPFDKQDASKKVLWALQASPSFSAFLDTSGLS